MDRVVIAKHIIDEFEQTEVCFIWVNKDTFNKFCRLLLEEGINCSIDFKKQIVIFNGQIPTEENK